MKTRIIISILLVFYISFTASSQRSRSKEKKKLVINGVVTSSDKAPVADAQIFLDSVNTGQVADDQGNYKVTVTGNSKKIFAYSSKFRFCDADICQMIRQEVPGVVVSGRSIRLLKGSDANLYGNDGASGVISITLIKGSYK
jgi:hypothetical protein